MLDLSSQFYFIRWVLDKLFVLLPWSHVTGFKNCIIGSKVTAILPDKWIFTYWTSVELHRKGSAIKQATLTSFKGIQGTLCIEKLICE